jgi:hypothetical protein
MTVEETAQSNSRGNHTENFTRFVLLLLAKQMKNLFKF